MYSFSAPMQQSKTTKTDSSGCRNFETTGAGSPLVRPGMEVEPGDGFANFIVTLSKAKGAFQRETSKMAQLDARMEEQKKELHTYAEQVKMLSTSKIEQVRHARILSLDILGKLIHVSSTFHHSLALYVHLYRKKKFKN